uniref:Uncharacterized protein n=1 Tax=Neolamprologus brichardi TaxID=32507 RepID=A0A3Q4N444_NEOBR
MPSKKDILSALREMDAISKQSEWKTFETDVNLSRSGHSSKFASRLERAINQRNSKNPRAYMSDSTGC